MHSGPFIKWFSHYTLQNKGATKSFLRDATEQGFLKKNSGVKWTFRSYGKFSEA